MQQCGAGNLDYRDRFEFPCSTHVDPCGSDEETYLGIVKESPGVRLPEGRSKWGRATECCRQFVISCSSDGKIHLTDGR